ncbi:VanZ family protein [Halalkalibacterium halodurans]|uniref:VanZ family protein n=2 Tax=Halalkalibacterium halodurans TaxID=86665 RepID=UPI0009F82C17
MIQRLYTNYRTSSYLVGLIVMAASIIIEFLQFLFGVGIPNIDDILLNTAGGVIGYGGYKLITFSKAPISLRS